MSHELPATNHGAFEIRARIVGAIGRFLAAAIWGGMYVVSKYVLDDIPPVIRLAIGAATLLLVRAAGRTRGRRAVSFECASRLT